MGGDLKGATAYNVASGRGFDAATQLLSEEYSDTLVRDGWVVYRSYDKAAHQTCIAHLLRRCIEMEETCRSGRGARPTR